MFKIGDFSRLAQVSVRMLRHYDKLGLLKPSHTDQWSGYRYYTIDQLPRLNRIVALNGLGVTLHQIGELLAEPAEPLSAESLRGMLLMRQTVLAQEVAEKQAQLAEVAARLQQIEFEGRPSPYEPLLKSIDALAVASLRQSVPTIAEIAPYCTRFYGFLYERLAAGNIEPIAPEVTIYHSEEYVETGIDVEFAVAVAPATLPLASKQVPGTLSGADDLIIRELPACPEAATLAFKGLYREIGPAMLALLSWIGTQGLAMAGPLREVHRSGPAHVGGILQEPAIIELQIPVARVSPGGPGA